MTTTPAARDEREVKSYRIELNGWNQQFITTDIPSGEYVSAADYALAESELAEVREQNRILRLGVKGDFDLDAWLEWAKKAEKLRAELERGKLDAQRYQVFRSTPSFGTSFGAASTPEQIDKLCDAAIDAARGVEG